MGTIYLIVGLLIAVIVLNAFDAIADCADFGTTGDSGYDACTTIKDYGWLVLTIYPIVIILQLLGVFRAIFGG